MTGVTITTPDTFYWHDRGDFLRITGNPFLWVCLSGMGSTLVLAKWTWISKVINWNPCNDLELAAGLWR